MTGAVDAATLAGAIVDACVARGLTVAVAESLTGGLLVAELIAVPGASATVVGCVVAYRSEIKRDVLGVSGETLARHGAVHPDVAAQMAVGVRTALAVDGRTADVGVSTTGVAGPGPADGHPAGTAFVGISIGADVRVSALELGGGREDIRRGVVSESLSALSERLGLTR